MKSTPKLQQIVTQIAAKHGVDLDRAGAHLRLELAGHGQLVIENIGASRVSVTNYIEVNRDWIADPQVVLYTASITSAEVSAPPASVWLPMETTELFGGWRLYAELDTQGELALYDPGGQAELARFCETVLARNLRDHGWLARAERVPAPFRSWSDEEIHASDIRLDDVLGVSEEESDA